MKTPLGDYPIEERTTRHELQQYEYWSNLNIGKPNSVVPISAQEEV